MLYVIKKAVFVLSLTLVVCASFAADGDKKKGALAPFDVASIVEYSRQFVGVPYRYGGMSPSGFDCSGLLNYIFEKHGMELSRSSSALFRDGVDVDLKEVSPGDFVFFKGQNMHSSKVRHVAMVVSISERGVSIIHATRRGVVIDLLDESTYYLPRFLGARRLYDFEALEVIRPILQGKNFPIPRI